MDNIKELPEETSTGLRLVNFIIDTFIIYVLFSFAMIFVSDIVYYNLPFNRDPHISDSMASIQIKLWGYAVWILIFQSYYIIFESTTTRTIGKLITGTKVVTIDGDKPTFKYVLVRSICRFIPFEPFTFLGELKAHDSLSKTIVVKKLRLRKLIIKNPSKLKKEEERLKIINTENKNYLPLAIIIGSILLFFGLYLNALSGRYMKVNNTYIYDKWTGKTRCDGVVIYRNK